jgi:hypothetical protein
LGVAREAWLAPGVAPHATRLPDRMPPELGSRRLQVRPSSWPQEATGARLYVISDIPFGPVSQWQVQLIAPATPFGFAALSSACRRMSKPAATVAATTAAPARSSRLLPLIVSSCVAAEQIPAGHGAAARA